ncbi:hypothetical protein [Streptomyces yaizuensis]|uniref:Uncharacterized protein n=1 Tax=Streptomyces yaizuensis TaxID=2989713 RepID=A0AA86M9C4_9ACTN|nr:hypothetical protein [Streptomyces sp. YSPA8]BDT39475.1 hypothetical protein SYYSPA8_36785 [Streptomyces sp. YSPA8]
MTLAHAPAAADHLDVSPAVSRLTPLTGGRPDADAALVVDQGPAWHCTVTREQSGHGFAAALSVRTADVAARRALAALWRGMEAVELGAGADGWALESWVCDGPGRWVHVGVPWLAEVDTQPRRDDGAVQVLCGTVRSPSRPWPADAPPVFVDESTGRVYPMQIEPHMFFTVGVTTLAPPA